MKLKLNLNNSILALGAAILIIVSCNKSDKSAEAEIKNAAQGETTFTAEAVPAVKKNVPVKDEKGWYRDWNEGMKAANSSQRPVIVDFYADWCKWCKVMDEKTFSDPQIKKTFSDGWVMIRVDTEDVDSFAGLNDGFLKYIETKFGTIDKLNGLMGSQFKTYAEFKPNYRQLAGAMGVSGLPSYLFIGKDGNPVVVEGNAAIVSGYIEKDQFVWVLDYFKNETYKKNLSLQKYIDSKTKK